MRVQKHSFGNFRKLPQQISYKPHKRILGPQEKYSNWVTGTGAGETVRSRHFAFKDYLDAYKYIDANREATMKVLIDVDDSEE